MTVYVVVGLLSGVLFAVLDVVINANPVAQRLFAVYSPIARDSINPVAGVAIDVLFGLIMAGAFLVLYDSLPGVNGVLKGVSFALLAWFFRVIMSAASQWMMFRVPTPTLLYSVVAGLGEMLALGLLYGVALTPAA